MTIPAMMNAIAISKPGSSDVLKPVVIPLPTPNTGEVLIQVVAAGINRPDIMQRKGLYPPPQGASEIPGLEVSGIVVGTGDKVSPIKTGDKVCALLTGGGYAQYCVAAAELCLPLPDGFTFEQAAALPETFFTVWSNVFNRGKLQTGEYILIHGGSSGIGTTAIQLAREAGAKVIITAGTVTKCKFCLDLGATAAINYNDLDFVEEVHKLTHNKGVDVILDMIGGNYFPRNIKCLAPDGRLIQIAIQNGPHTELNLLPVMLKRLTITGSTLRARNLHFKTEIALQLIEKVWPQLSSGKIKPVIQCIFPLNEASEAHRLMESSQHIGKIILIP